MADRYKIIDRATVLQYVADGITDTGNDPKRDPNRIANRFYSPDGKKFQLYQLVEAYDYAARMKYELVATAKYEKIAHEWANGSRTDIQWIDYSAVDKETV